MDLRLLAHGDEAALEAFLLPHTDSSMFLRSNARAAGLVYAGAPLEATYAAALESGTIVGVAAHCWNGLLLVQAARHLAPLVRFTVRQSGRPLTGLSGPANQVSTARRALRLHAITAAKASTEALYALALDDLIVPPGLTAEGVVCRRARMEDLDRLVEWRLAFGVEALGRTASPALADAARSDILLHHERDTQWILFDAGQPVSYAAFNAAVPDAVQVGGVWTPPALRGRGYARAVTAGALIDARSAGARRAVLFSDNPAAQRAYEAIGFRQVGKYGLVLFREPVIA